MAYALSRSSKVMLSTTISGTYTCLEGVLTWDNAETGTDDQSNYVLCDEAPIVETGTDDSTLELTGLRDLTATQQTLLRTARSNGTTIFARVLEDGTDGWTQPFVVTRFNTRADANGTALAKYVQWTATLTSAGARVDYTAP